MKNTRKAQMEMMGLAIVVVLLVIGMAFVFRALAKTPERMHEKFTKEQTAQSILIAMGRSVTECRELDITELMQNCGDSVNDAEELIGLGQRGSIECSGGKDSCRYINSSVKWIFDNTLRLQRLPYRFMMYKGSIDNPILYVEDGGCSKQNIAKRMFNVEKPGELTLPLPSGGTVFARLDICTKP